eukprot:m.12234 g.12234  ORF g.12234 m.12234 type:complete len:225 (+) comp3968_c0_seq1:437-1111(+)
MGGTVSSYFNFSSWWKNTPVKIIMNGLDAAGKTTVLYKMKLGEVVTTIPTIGFNVESVHTKGGEFVIWDVGGRSGIRALYVHYMKDMDAYIFVVDSNDTCRLEEVKSELQQAIKQADSLAENAIPVAILANKQDLSGSLSPEELVEKLDLNKILEHHQWNIFPCVGTNGEGLGHLLKWISNAIATQKSYKQFQKNIVNKVPNIPLQQKKLALNANDKSIELATK